VKEALLLTLSTTGSSDLAAVREGSRRLTRRIESRWEILATVTARAIYREDRQELTLLEIAAVAATAAAVVLGRVVVPITCSESRCILLKFTRKRSWRKRRMNAASMFF
jgi:hypothetical protein